MFRSSQSGASAYANIGIETGVGAASPHKLIVMLFDGALDALAGAARHMKAGNIPEKGRAISHAITIIDQGLRASLNKQNGGEIADSLDSLYEYMGRRLLQANLKNQPELLEEVQRLLTELRSAWNAIGAAATPAAEAPPPRPVDDHTARPAMLARA